jgi:hypothetical protein
MILVFMGLAQAPSLAATAESVSYKITASVLDAGGGTGESATYLLLGKARDFAFNLPTPPASISYTLGEGFLRSIFYGPILGPFILSVSPNSGYNDTSVSVNISGGNFNTTLLTTVELQLGGQPSIVATNVSVESFGTITCTFNLTGAVPGYWTIYVNNGGSPATLASAFHIVGAPLDIIGTVYNFPNPFDPDDGPTTIKYTLTVDADIIINLYNINGEKIWYRRFPAGTEGGKAGLNQVIWNARNVFDASVPNGVYVCQIATPNGKTLAIVKIAVLR